MNKYVVTVSYDSTYEVEAKDEREAKSKAWDWFIECELYFEIEKVDSFESEEEKPALPPPGMAYVECVDEKSGEPYLSYVPKFVAEMAVALFPGEYRIVLEEEIEFVES